MSADNGIYILLTDGEKGPEYRVTYATAIDNIYGEWNVDTAKYDGNIQAIKQTFGEAKVFFTLNEALDYAENCEHEAGYLEDGICVISDFQSYGYLFG